MINIDDAMGTGGWPGAGVGLPGITGAVSAVSFANDSLIYCATTSGQVYRLDLARHDVDRAGAARGAAADRSQWIWDVQSLPATTTS